ncbi:MAG TPA: hypothetical protein VKM72_12040 [Thermoanaerobaculia bacterium]|nr:hypothetical protein [Thermoanaerobaculia bacterium]
MHRRLLLSALLLALAAPASAKDARSTEVLRLDCANTLGRRELTLFANGTIRLRDGKPGEELMGLAELGPAEYQAFIERLKAENLSEVGRLPTGVEGDWVERCMLALDLPGQAPRIIHFGHYDTLPLPLARLLLIGQDLAAKVTTLEGAERLPENYEPRRHDVLRRVDGNLYRVEAFTVDGKGVELHGVYQPVAIYVQRDQFRMEFTALVSRRK